ncbi:MAG: 2-oxo acid dehydrogenase subunit E2 [Chthoniobacterales bacterium]|nr:2-oxo acid dehydrogenase subunit E2 [Chthoniobacterales bacterium]
MPGLSNKDKLRLLTILLESRHGDLREQNLNRQGKGHFHVSGMGHEALAAISFALEPDDYIFPYYRDRALVLGRGVASRELALDYMAKRKGQSGGRQMPSHYSYADRNIWSVPTPTGAQLLPACGVAWGMKLDGKPNFVVATVGDAATRQGDFFEAVCFAKEKQLPVLFVVEDNAYGISSPTRKTNPLAIGVLQPNDWREIDGTDMHLVHEAATEAIAHLRGGKGPIFFWVKMERLSSHTSSDDQKLYRSAEELQNLEHCDPLKKWKERLLAEKVITADEYEKLDKEIKERIRKEFVAAEKEDDPAADELELHVIAELPQLDEEVLPAGKYRIGDTVNKTLRLGLQRDGNRIIFGQDIEDPKGGVFRLTQRLSTEFPEQVFNSPLAESTILGVACGLASYGKRPVFELQFVDFINPAWNQLVTNLSTLRWRSFGTWTCPVVIYAPYGAYLPGGSLWHSQANEAPLAHYPGINIAIPSTPEDAAGLLWTAMHADDPTFILIPKHLLWAEHESAEPLRAVPLGKARIRSHGTDVTLVAWGNTVEKSLEALEVLGTEASLELIDLRSIAPWDRGAIEQSVRKTGRLVVVQEDTENCSVGQMIITHIASQPDIWNEMVSPPTLVSKGNVMIGYNPIYEYAALPDVERIVAAIRRSLSMRGERAAVAPVQQRAEAAVAKTAESHVTDRRSEQSAHSITVPIMGEGIRNAKVVTLLKKSGDPIELDDPLCEVETDKAVYPIESSFAGTMGEWKTQVGATVEIGQEIGTILSGEASWDEQLEAAAEVSPDEKWNGSTDAAEASASSAERSISRAAVPRRIEPALSPTITRRLGRVVPANLQIDARWDAISSARAAAKKADPKNAASPSVMVAWAVVKAMEQHPPFRRLMLDDDSIVENDEFDLGIAVSLEGDRLATAVVTRANKRAWPDFVQRYNETVAETRGGRVDAVNAPLVISSLGAFGVRAAVPIVVPPSVGTLFVGSAHQEMAVEGRKSTAAEVITLSLTFDHRVVNGTGAANFVHSIKEQIEAFRIPITTAVAKS